MTKYATLLGFAILGMVGGDAWGQTPAASAPIARDGFHKFFIDGGPIVWFILLPMSLLTLSLIVQYALTIRKSRLIPPTVIRRLENLMAGSNLNATQDYLNQQTNLLARTLSMGLLESRNGRPAMEQAMSDVLEQDISAHMRKIEWLNILGNVAPMVGLFGTVWGMIDAFNQIVQAGGQPEPADLAGGISVALITTWWGLIIAIPALATYGLLRNCVDAAAAEVSLTIEKLLAGRLTGW